MAKKSLVIVESPTKAKTISKFLGTDYIVKSSFGHIRDLPKSQLGVDVEGSFHPTYEIPEKAQKKVDDLLAAVKRSDNVILATDEDREGEAIAWHLVNALNIADMPISRIVFHEITKSAIEEALKHPRQIDQKLVDAQQARRVLDRLVGYKLSPLLWSKIQRGLSAGRVQSVAVRMIVERERERLAFKKEEYWTVEGQFEKDAQEIAAKLNARDGVKLKKFDITKKEQADEILEAVKGKDFVVEAVTKKAATRKPPTPLRTSVLQQDANNSLGFSAKQTMTLAQKLYETGLITYMRTDSMNLSEKFLKETQTYLNKAFGSEYATGSQTYTKKKAKGAQEAHEAIRPTEVTRTPDSVKGELEAGQWKLYNLIWSRSVASQMPNAKLERTAIDMKADKYTFRANGSVITFDGFMKVYKSAKETLLPEMKEGDKVASKKIEAKQHFTEPPARYSDATLVKALEEHGIGRPSTYAPTISTVINRGYVDRDDNKKLYPLDIAMVVNDMLVDHFSDIVNLEFTANLENELDEIADGKKEWIPMIKDFYEPFAKNLEEKGGELKREDIVPEKELGKHPDTGQMIYVKTGRFGTYLQLGEWSEEDRKAKKNKPKSSSLLKGMTMDTITLEDAVKLLSLPRELGEHTDGNVITVQNGPYGPYMKAGKTNVSLPEEYDPLTITPEQAQDLMKNAAELKKKQQEPLAELGLDPESKAMIQVKTGRYGPYVTDGKTNASIKKSLDPADITFEMAVEMLEKKRKAPKRKRKTSTKKKK